MMFSVFGQKLLSAQQGVGRCFVMVEEPITSLPQLGMFLPQIVMQPFQNFHIKTLVECSAWRNTFGVHNPSHIFGGWWDVAVFHWLDCRFVSGC